MAGRLVIGPNDKIEDPAGRPRAARASSSSARSGRCRSMRASAVPAIHRQSVTARFVCLSRIHVVGQASRLSLTLNDRLEAVVLEVPGRSPQGERKFIGWRQARRPSYASGPTQRVMATASFRPNILAAVLTATGTGVFILPFVPCNPFG